MALPLPTGLTPTEVAFLCEMEMVTVIPRQRLESLDLLAVRKTPPTPPKPSKTSLNTPHFYLNTNTKLFRAQHNPSAHPTAPNSPSGSPSSSNANAEPTSSPRPGCSPPPSIKSSNTKPRSRPTHSRLLLHIPTPSPSSPPLQTSYLLLSCPRAQRTPRLTIYLIIGWNWARYCWRLVVMIFLILIEYARC